MQHEPDDDGDDPRPDLPGPPAPGEEDDGSYLGSWEELENTLADAARRAELLAGFEPGGAWACSPPGPELAAAVAEAAGRDGTWALATGPQRIGLLRAMAALQSWTSAGLLGVARALIRDESPDCPPSARHGALPDDWDESLTHQVALALAVSVRSADKTLQAAWELGARLPGIDLLLKDGTLDLPRAKLITEVFAGLSDEDCAKAEALLLPRLTEGPRKTWTQIDKLATAIAAQVDPGLAEREREHAERRRCRVTMFRERSGTAALTGRDLPADQTLAAYANVSARADQYKQSGVFPGEPMDRLRATAYLDILNAITAADRIAHGRLTPDDDPDDDNDPGDGGPDDNAGPDGGSRGAGPGASPGGGPDDEAGPFPGGSDCPCRECDGRCAPPDDGHGPDGPDDEPKDDGPGHGPDDDPGDSGPDDGPDYRHSDDELDDGRGGQDQPGDDDPGGGLAGDGTDGHPTDGDKPGGGDHSAQPKLTDLVLPLATLLGHARRPGEGHGLGTIDPALCRAIAALAARSPHTTVCLTITDHHGIAIGHGCGKPHRPARGTQATRPAPAGALGPPGRPARPARPPGGPLPPLVALPARINLTITASRLAQLRAQPHHGPPDPTPTGWALVPPDTTAARTPGTALARPAPEPPGDPDWRGTWTLTLPTGQAYAVSLGPVPTFDCDHRHQSHAYQPNDTLRHLVQVRDYECTFPTCNRHARDSDFEHATPYDQGGRTCGCNAGARSRTCHRVKQSPGWNLTQPKPGWHQWTTPRGWTYTQGPKRYPV